MKKIILVMILIINERCLKYRYSVWYVMENRVDILDIFIDFYNNKIFLRMEGIYELLL